MEGFLRGTARVRFPSLPSRDHSGFFDHLLNNSGK
jgi:hypothetical protein